MIIKRIGWVHGLNPRTLKEDTETGKWSYISHHLVVHRPNKQDYMEEYKLYKKYIQSLPKYEIQIEK